MTGFLNPLFLTIGAAAVLVPILIHLLLRNKAVRIEFAAMRFLTESNKPVVRWLRLKQLLILLLRILAVAMLGLAFARPFLAEDDGFALFQEGEKEVALLIDISASLGASDHLDRARQQVERLLGAQDEKSFVTICLAGSETVVLSEREPWSASLAARTTAALKPVHEPGNLRESLRFVDDILRGSPVFDKEIWILSDFQRTSWPDDSGLLQLSSRAEVKLVPLAEAPWRNAALLDVRLPQEKGQPWACTVIDHSGGRLKEATVELHVSGRKRAERKVSFASGKAQVVQFGRVALPSKAASGRFELRADADAFAADNALHFVTSPVENTRVLVVNGEASAGASDEIFFLSRAIDVAGSEFSLTKLDFSNLNQVRPRAFDILILANVKAVNRRVLERVETFVQQGGGLLLAPGDRVEPDLFNRFFRELAPATVSKPARAKVDRSEGDILLLSNVDHPAVQLFADPVNGDFSDARFFQHWLLEPGKGAEVLASFTSGGPAIIASNSGRGRIVQLSFPLDTEWSNLPVKATYLPLLHSMLSWLEPEKEVSGSTVVGKPIFLGEKFPAAAPIDVELPDGAKSKLAEGQQIFADTALPGIYTFAQQGLKRSMAVNIDPAESSTELTAEQAFLARLDDGGASTSIDQPQTAATIGNVEAESKQKFWKLLILAALFVLLSESLLANRTPR